MNTTAATGSHTNRPATADTVIGAPLPGSVSWSQHRCPASGGMPSASITHIAKASTLLASRTQWRVRRPENGYAAHMSPPGPSRTTSATCRRPSRSVAVPPCAAAASSSSVELGGHPVAANNHLVQGARGGIGRDSSCSMLATRCAPRGADAAPLVVGRFVGHAVLVLILGKNAQNRRTPSLDVHPWPRYRDNLSPSTARNWGVEPRVRLAPLAWHRVESGATASHTADRRQS